ncbi:TerC family protein [Kitasatospora arboriphila]
MDVSLGLWIGTIGVLVALIVADFFIGGRKPHEVSVKEAGIWTVVWIVLAVLFGAFLWKQYGSQPASEFFVGYITEKSLSVDNLFVFILIMGKFAVPRIYQQRVLMFGVIIALVLRAVFIAAARPWSPPSRGSSTSSAPSSSGRRGSSSRTPAPTRRRSSRRTACSRRSRSASRRPTSTTAPSSSSWRTAARLMTPMLIVMLAIGTTDVLFALDSIPAIFGLTQDPYIVFTANAFALMGLRQLYFLIGGLLKKLVHLAYGLSVILGFIGVKLVLHALHESGVHVPEVSIGVSLGFIVAVLAVTTVTSLVASRRQERAALEAVGERDGADV